jgi:hypothetical protein
MSMHNPLCLHGGAHAPSECRDRWNQPLAQIEASVPVSQVAEIAVEVGDEALKLTPAAAGNVLKDDELAAPAQ